MESIFKDIFMTLKKKIQIKLFFVSILKIFLNFFLHDHKESFRWKKTLDSTCMQHDMPQSLLVFAVSSTPETPNFWTFSGVAHPLEELRKHWFLTVFMHISKI